MIVSDEQDALLFMEAEDACGMWGKANVPRRFCSESCRTAGQHVAHVPGTDGESHGAVFAYTRTNKPDTEGSTT